MQYRASRMGIGVMEGWSVQRRDCMSWRRQASLTAWEPARMPSAHPASSSRRSRSLQQRQRQRQKRQQRMQHETQPRCALHSCSWPPVGHVAAVPKDHHRLPRPYLSCAATASKLGRSSGSCAQHRCISCIVAGTGQESSALTTAQVHSPLQPWAMGNS